MTYTQPGMGITTIEALLATTDLTMLEHGSTEAAGACPCGQELLLWNASSFSRAPAMLKTFSNLRCSLLREDTRGGTDPTCDDMLLGALLL